ncbi:MAG: hypothetical protein H6611_00875 [Ignavibacteriales bacterium]|nr:hypothetical protein [Ignavibacteriales bacterium]
MKNVKMHDKMSKMHKHGEKMDKKHSADCSCGMCSAKGEMKEGTKKMSDAHPADCSCNHCKMAKAEMKNMHEKHPESCNCDGCAKS